MPVSAGESARAYSTRQLRSTICTGAMRRRLADGKRRNGRTDFGGLFPLFIAGNFNASGHYRSHLGLVGITTLGIRVLVGGVDIRLRGRGSLSR